MAHDVLELYLRKGVGIKGAIFKVRKAMYRNETHGHYTV